MTNSLWNKMWAESKFVPAGTDESIPLYDPLEDRIEKLERRVQVLENRLKRLSGI
tara:strand:- start:744 stop:908 length:165 start_codon:yes stop_codon:yes gene_type:complete